MVFTMAQPRKGHRTPEEEYLPLTAQAFLNCLVQDGEITPEPSELTLSANHCTVQVTMVWEKLPREEQKRFRQERRRQQTDTSRNGDYTKLKEQAWKHGKNLRRPHSDNQTSHAKNYSDLFTNKERPAAQTPEIQSSNRQPDSSSYAAVMKAFQVPGDLEGDVVDSNSCQEGGTKKTTHAKNYSDLFTNKEKPAAQTPKIQSSNRQPDSSSYAAVMKAFQDPTPLTGDLEGDDVDSYFCQEVGTKKTTQAKNYSDLFTNKEKPVAQTPKIQSSNRQQDSSSYAAVMKAFQDPTPLTGDLEGDDVDSNSCQKVGTEKTTHAKNYSDLFTIKEKPAAQTPKIQSSNRQPDSSSYAAVTKAFQDPTPLTGDLEGDDVDSNSCQKVGTEKTTHAKNYSDLFTIKEEPAAQTPKIQSSNRQPDSSSYAAVMKAFQDPTPLTGDLEGDDVDSYFCQEVGTKKTTHAKNYSDLFTNKEKPKAQTPKIQSSNRQPDSSS